MDRKAFLKTIGSGVIAITAKIALPDIKTSTPVNIDSTKTENYPRILGDVGSMGLTKEQEELYLTSLRN